MRTVSIAGKVSSSATLLTSENDTWPFPAILIIKGPDMGQYQIFVQYQYFLKSSFQNQYQNSSKSFFNIKIKINIKNFPNSISKSISKFFKVQNQYQNQHQYFDNIDVDFDIDFENQN